MPDTTPTNGNQNTPVNIEEEKGFCTVLQDVGTKSLYSKDVKDFCSLVNTASTAWIDYIVEDFEHDVLKTAVTLGFSEVLITNLLADPRSGYEDFGTELGILLPVIRADGFNVTIDKLMILIKQNVLITLHSTEVKRFSRMRRYAANLMQKLPQNMPQNDRITVLLSRIIDENNARNFDYLREIEEQGDRMSQELSDPKTPREVLGPKIHQMKHALIMYLGGLWTTVDVMNSLRYGDADLITDNTKLLNKLNGLHEEVTAHIGLAEHLSEVLASGLEALQSIYNNQLQVLNNRLALMVGYLTIIGTALLVPNTIATVAGNNMFEFTKNDAPWYLSLIVISTVVATVVSWYAVKKLGLLPKSPE
ncbi:MAG: magnesium transporter CorA [Euryarchaeota archaeon]|nr:magnesium transporter CorA [Euryarchaeota archaeon]